MVRRRRLGCEIKACDRAGVTQFRIGPSPSQHHFGNFEGGILEATTIMILKWPCWTQPDPSMMRMLGQKRGMRSLPVSLSDFGSMVLKFKSQA